MAYIKTKAIVVNKKQYKENDFLITVISQSLGKIIFIAKGASNFNSNRNATLQLGNLISIDLYQKNNFYWLSDTKTIKNFIKTKKNLNQIKFTFYFLETINQLATQNQNTHLLFTKSLKIIQAIENNSYNKYIDYQIELIDMLGFGIPQNIVDLQKQKQYVDCQKYLLNYIQSIIEAPLQSSKII